MKRRKTFTQMSIDTDLAQTVWNMMDYVEHSAEPIENVAFHMSEDEDGHTRAGFTKYHPEDDDDSVIAVLSVEPNSGYGDDVDDEDMKKAMRFMYFYQCLHMVIENYIADHCPHHHD